MTRVGVLLLLALGLVTCSDEAQQGDRGSPTSPPRDADAIHCDAYQLVAEVELNIILPKCGRVGDGSCHASGNVVPHLFEVGAMAAEVLDRPGALHCHNDKVVSRATPEDSYLLAKVRATQSNVTCADGSNGGSRMPYQDAPQLTADEIDCLRWWVHRIVE
jgi:hypothetical protein